MSASPVARVLVVRRSDRLARCAVTLRDIGADVDETSTVDDGVTHLRRRSHDLVLTDLPVWTAPERRGPCQHLLARVRAERVPTPVVVALESSSADEARDVLLTGGATDCVRLAALTPAHLFALLLRFKPAAGTGSSKLVGISPAIQRVRSLAARAARSSPCSCTGRRVRARSSWRTRFTSSARGQRRRLSPSTAASSRPPCSLRSCSAPSAERSPAPSASASVCSSTRSRAPSSLDEIAELPLEGQAALLRALDSGTIRRVGGATAIPFAARLVAASHRDLRDEVRRGRFREDLYFRLAGITITVPPLSDRRQDIPLLVDAFARDADRTVHFTDDAKAILAAQPWPGNVRQLKTTVRALIDLHDDRVFDAGAVSAFLPSAFVGTAPAEDADLADVRRAVRGLLAKTLPHPPGDVLRDVLFEEALAIAGSHRRAAALVQRERKVIDRWATVTKRTYTSPGAGGEEL